MEAKRYAIKFSFEGSLFDGYSRQRSGHTVEGYILDGIAKAGIASDGREARFASAARVDRGVSAIGAAIAFDTSVDKDRILRSLNASCPSIVAHSIAGAPPTFDPRRQAVMRWYRYHFGGMDMDLGLDVPAMRIAAQAFIGEHDFSAFARLDGRNPIRTVQRISVERKGGSIVLDVRGRSFLWNQVRRMAGALRQVGRHEVGPGAIETALEAGWGGRKFPTAAADGLFLMDVVYKGLEFDLAPTFPKGTVRAVRDGHHKGLCTVRYYEYLRSKVHI
jgi:tRNA pseudouridine38-40 synthase